MNKKILDIIYTETSGILTELVINEAINFIIKNIYLPNNAITMFNIIDKIYKISKERKSGANIISQIINCYYTKSEPEDVELDELDKIDHNYVHISKLDTIFVSLTDIIESKESEQQKMCALISVLDSISKTSKNEEHNKKVIELQNLIQSMN